MDGRMYMHPTINTAAVKYLQLLDDSRASFEVQIDGPSGMAALPPNPTLGSAVSQIWPCGHGSKPW